MTRNKKKILLTGAAGFIGSAVRKRLEIEGYKVYPIDNFSRGRNFEKIIKCSVFDKKKLKNYVLKSDIIIHLAAINGTKNFYNIPEKVFEVSIRGILNIYDAIPKKSKKKILVASSGEVYGEPPKIPTDENVRLIVPNILNDRYSYGGGKIAQDLITRFLVTKKIKDCIIFRPHNVYGPNMGKDHVIPELFYKAIKSKKKLRIQGSGDETRSFCYIDDFVDGLVLLLKKKNRSFQIYNIGNNKEISIKNLAKKILNVLNKDTIKIQKGKLLEGSSKRRKPSIDKLKKIHYKPSVQIEQGLELFLKNDSYAKSIR